MTQSSAPWDGISVGDAADSPYSASEWAALWALLHGVGSVFPNYGIIPGTGDGSHDPLQVLATSVASTNVQVHPGAALVNGRLYKSTAAESIAVGANASGNPRIDTLILRADYTAQTIRLVLKQGTPAGSPVHPSLQQDASIWEIPLADIAAANGFSVINNVDITNRQRSVNTSASGWLPYAYPLDYLPGNAYANGFIWGTNVAMAIPFAIAGNMLVERIVMFGRGNASPEITWGIYTQNGNDANVNDKTLYRIGGRETTASIAVVTGARLNIPAIPAPVSLKPGAYWLLILVKTATMTIASVDRSGGGAFDENAHQLLTKSAVSSLGQTEDLTSGWGFSATTDDAYAIRLDGRVFGQVTAF